MNPASSFLHPATACRDPLWARFLACCFVAIAGFRLTVIEHFGVSMPFVDEWIATARKVLAPWTHGTFTTSALFEAHLGDHRIVATRLWEILWFELNGGWDPKLVMLTKALVYSAAATMFVHLLSRGLDRGRYMAAGVLTVLFAIPFGYMNLLWAFQSQFDFFMLAAAGAWLALLSGRLVSALVIAAAAPFTLAAGPIVAASFLIVPVAAYVEQRWKARRCLWFGGGALAITVGGVLLRVAEGAPPHTLGEKAFTLLNLVGWPYTNLTLLVYRLPETARLFPGRALRFPSAEHSILNATAEAMHSHFGIVVAIAAVLTCLMLTPLAVLAFRVARQRRIPACAWGPLAVGVFALLLQAATALVRAGELTVQARYLDVVALTGFASMAAAFALASEERRYRRRIAIWFAVLAPGYLVTTVASFKQMQNAHWPQMLGAVQAYFPKHDRSVFPEVNTNWQLPTLDPVPVFADILDDPEVDAVLPASVTNPAAGRRPLALAASAVAKRSWMVALLAGIAAGGIAWQARRHREPLGRVAPSVAATPSL